MTPMPASSFSSDHHSRTCRSHPMRCHDHDYSGLIAETSVATRALSKTEIASVACIVYGNRTCELPCTMQRKPQCRRAGGYPCIFPRGVWHSLHYCVACKLDDDDAGMGAGAFIVDEAHETHVFIKPACKKSAKGKVKLTYNTLLAKYKIKPAVHEACPDFYKCEILTHTNFNKLS